MQKKITLKNFTDIGKRQKFSDCWFSRFICFITGLYKELCAIMLIRIWFLFISWHQNVAYELTSIQLVFIAITVLVLVKTSFMVERVNDLC